ncbi:MAG: type IV pilin protein [Propionivibrio sp.]
MRQSLHWNCGFTLIELMVVVAIIAILASVGYPSYTEYVQRSRIAEATSGLSDWRIRMERYYQDNRTYVKDDSCGAGVPPGESSSSFQFDCAAAAADTYTLRATGVAAGGMNGFVFTVNQSNQRTTVFPGVSGTQNCWMTRRSDAC